MPRATVAHVNPGSSHSPLVVPAGGDISSSVVDLAENLLSEDAPSIRAAQDGLEQLRRRARATEAIFWAILGGTAHRIVHAGRRAADTAASVDVGEGGMAIARLRRTGIVVCRFDEISGVEDLVPHGVDSFVAAGVTSRGAISGALVLGWAGRMPQWDAAKLRHLRIAAGLLAKTATGIGRTSEDSATADAVLGSVSDRIAVVDRTGTIVRVNAAWTESTRQQDLAAFEPMRPGRSYLEACRTAAVNGLLDAAELAGGVEAVCSGASALFETTYRAGTGDDWCMVTVTPLRHPDGGAVVVHSDVTPRRIMQLARRHGDDLFRRLADTLPVPVCMLATGGTLLFANQQWIEAAGGPGGQAGISSDWTEALHPDDRSRATSAFRSAVANDRGFHIEVRLNAADASFRWSECMAAPMYDSEGKLERLVVIGRDISAKRRAEASIVRIGARLVAAQENERSRIARELHDDLGQQVALLASRLDVAVRPDASRKRARAELSAARRTLQDLATAVHNLSHELHPAKLKLLGLGLTLEALCRDVAAESGVPIAFDRSGIPPDVPEDAALCIFRVTQEALRNAVKHSAARNIAISVAWTPSRLTLRIADDGSGFDPLASPSTGLGMLTMRERVELVGGRLTVETAQGQGTLIEAALPIPQRRRVVPQGGPDSAA